MKNFRFTKSINIINLLKLVIMKHFKLGLSLSGIKLPETACLVTDICEMEHPGVEKCTLSDVCSDDWGDCNTEDYCYYDFGNCTTSVDNCGSIDFCDKPTDYCHPSFDR